MRRKLLILLGLLCATTAIGQGRILYTWHGAQNLFQASFQIYDWEQAPGIEFALADSTHLFERTLTVTSQDHTWVGGGSYYSGFHPDLYLDAICSDPLFPGAVYLGADSIGMDVSSHELGFWTFAAVPEPSCAGLLGLGLFALLSKRAVRR
jgi:hypothetical protein